MALHWTVSSMFMSLLYRGAQNWAQYSKCGLTSAEQRGRITTLHLLAVLCVMQPRIPFAFFAARAHSWLKFNLVSTGTPSAFSAKLLYRWVSPSVCWCLGLFVPRSRTLYFPMLNFMRYLSAHFSRMLRSLGMTAWPSHLSATPLMSVQSAYLLRVHSASSSRSLMEMLNRTGPSTDSWGTSLVTSVQISLLWVHCWLLTNTLCNGYANSYVKRVHPSFEGLYTHHSGV